MAALEDAGLLVVKRSADDEASSSVKEGFDIEFEIAGLSTGKTLEEAKLFCTVTGYKNP